MAGSKERICIACKGKYHYCPNCEADANKPVWMYAFCSEECKETFTIVRDYCSGTVTKAGAKELLSGVVKNPFSKFEDTIEKRLNEIFEVDMEDHMNVPEETSEPEKKNVRTPRKRAVKKTEQ